MEVKHQLMARVCENDNTHWIGCSCGWWHEKRLLGPFDYLSRVAAALHYAAFTKGTDSVPP